MMVLPLFHFDTRLLTSKHAKVFSTYLVAWNGATWKSWFSARQNAENEHQQKHKNQVRNWRFLECWVLGYERLYLSL